MIKLFGITMLTVMGLALAALVLSPSIAAQTASPVVISNALVPGVGFFTLLDSSNPFSTELVSVQVQHTSKSGYMLIYQIVDFGGGFSAFGSGSIPTSSVNVSGGSVDAGKVMVTLNVNTCDVPGFTTSFGPCGTFVLTWVEVPASVGGSFATRGVTQQTFPGGGKVVTSGEMKSFSASTTGTALGFVVPTPTGGSLTQETNVTKTITGL